MLRIPLSTRLDHQQVARRTVPNLPTFGTRTPAHSRQLHGVGQPCAPSEPRVGPAPTAPGGASSTTPALRHRPPPRRGPRPRPVAPAAPQSHTTQGHVVPAALSPARPLARTARHNGAQRDCGRPAATPSEPPSTKPPPSATPAQPAIRTPD